MNPRLLSTRQVRFLLRLSISTALIGVLFKIMHWSGATVLFLGGCLGVAFFYVIRFLQKSNKTLLDYAKLFLLVSFLCHYTFRIFHLKYGNLFTMLTQIALVVFLVLYIRDVYFAKQNDLENSEGSATGSTKRRTIAHLLNGLATISIVIGALLKILHWEIYFLNGTLLLGAGLLAAAISILLNSNGPDR